MSLDELEALLAMAWTDFLDANPDDLTSPEDLPDHALMTGAQFEHWAMQAVGGFCRPDLPALIAERDRLREALTPSADTKAAFMGEFHFNVIDRDEDGEEVTRKVYVPWDTVKQIMAAISGRASLGASHDAR